MSKVASSAVIRARNISHEAVDRYLDEWIAGLADVTVLVRTIRNLLRDGDEAGAPALLPAERPYPLPEHLAATIGASPT